MNYLFDTNILVFIARDNSGYRIIEKMNPDNKIVYVSYANIAEIESIAFQNGWKNNRMKRLELFLDNVRIIEMSDTFLKTYLEIDAYSQKKHPNFDSYPFDTPRNMGKHDLWTVRRCDCCYGFTS